MNSTGPPGNALPDMHQVSPAHCEEVHRVIVKRNLARFDLATIELTVLCAEAGSLSAAARIAKMSLPRASHRLRSMEHSIGTSLFKRSHDGLHTTAAGDVFVEYARGLLTLMDALISGIELLPASDTKKTAPSRRGAE